MMPFVALLSSAADTLATSGLLAQETMPRLDGMYWVMLLSRFFHILGAIMLVGGIYYLRTVVSPSLPASASVDQRFGGSRATWAKVVGIATLLLLVTGFWNYIQNAKQYQLATSYHMIAGLKMLAALALFFLSALVAGRTHLAENIRQRMLFWLRVSLTLGLVAVILGSVLRSYPHNPKSVEGPKLEAPSIPPPSVN